MGDFLSGLVRYLHVFTAVMWVGGIFLWSMLIAPSLAKRLPPQVAAPFGKAVIPRLTSYLTIAGVLALLSGVWLLAMLWDGDMRAGFEAPNGYGIGMTLGLVAAIAMLGVAIGLIRPAATRLVALPPPQPGAAPSAEGPALMKKLKMGGMINMLLGTLALAAMVWSVNVFR